MSTINNDPVNVPIATRLLYSFGLKATLIKPE